MVTQTAPTVLLVDADPDSRTIYSLILEHHGDRVLHAATGEEAFPLACDRNVRLVVTELFIAPVDGRTLAERLKQDPRTAHLPVIALTSMPAHPGVPGASSVDSYLAKPCVPTRVLEEVRRHLHAVEVSAV